jgi:hypothetical protein
MTSVALTLLQLVAGWLLCLTSCWLSKGFAHSWDFLIPFTEVDIVKESTSNIVGWPGRYINIFFARIYQIIHLS